MAFDNLPELATKYITDLAANVENGTHVAEVVRYSGTVNDPRAHIVQLPTGDAEKFTIWLEGYAAGEAFQRIIARGYMKGGWADADTWEGTIDESALEEYRTL